MSMMEVPQRTAPKFVEPDLPNKPPLKNTNAFDEPKDVCSISHCPSFANACGLCDYHCGKIHNHNHRNLTHDTLEELIDKYLRNNDITFSKEEGRSDDKPKTVPPRKVDYNKLIGSMNKKPLGSNDPNDKK